MAPARSIFALLCGYVAPILRIPHTFGLSPPNRDETDDDNNNDNDNRDKEKTPDKGHNDNDHNDQGPDKMITCSSVPYSDPAPFLQLPAEIRLAIYNYLYDDADPGASRTITIKASRFLGFGSLGGFGGFTTSAASSSALLAASASTQALVQVTFSTAQDAGILGACHTTYREAFQLYWRSFTVVVDAPVGSIPLALQRIPASLSDSLRTAVVQHHLVRPVDPTAAKHASDWTAACTSLARTLRRVTQVTVRLTGDMGALAALAGRVQFFRAFFDSGLVGDAGSLQCLVLEWDDDGWAAEAKAATAAMASEGAVVAAPGSNRARPHLRTFTFTSWTRLAVRELELVRALEEEQQHHEQQRQEQQHHDRLWDRSHEPITAAPDCGLPLLEALGG